MHGVGAKWVHNTILVWSKIIVKKVVRLKSLSSRQGPTSLIALPIQTKEDQAWVTTNGNKLLE